MLTLLDTSVLIAMREGVVPVIQRSGKLERRALVSIVSVIELEGGVPVAKEGAQIRRQKLDEIYEVIDVLPFDPANADAYRRIVEALGFSRSNIIDRMIAAQAIVAGAALATLNPRDFRAIPGLRIDDWSR